MKLSRQFSLATLMLGTTCVAGLFAVLPYPFVAYYLLLILFFTAAVLYRIGPVEARSFWRWFAACGWLYVILHIENHDLTESSSLWLSMRTWLERGIPSSYEWLDGDYRQFSHSLIALFVALAGGVLIPWLTPFDQTYTRE
jgi:hypothetical protein